MTTWPGGALILALGASATLAGLSPPPPSPALARIEAHGRRLERADGQPFVWRFATGFRLVDYVADGEEASAIAFLDWLQATGFNGVRSLSALCCWFDLPPAEGQRALPRTLELAAERGIYLEIVAMTGLQPDQMRQHVRALGEICAAHVNCAAIELANENAHPSQDERLTHNQFLAELRDLVPPGIPVSMGSNCCGQSDEQVIYPGGTYVTVHRDRTLDTWNRVRRMRELERISGESGVPVADDEPIGAAEEGQPGRRSNHPDEFFAAGALARVFDVLPTFHFDDGLHAHVPGPVQQACAEAFVAGTSIVPDDVRLSFRSAGGTRRLESPVKSFEGALDVFSGVSDRVSVVVGIGTEPDFSIELREGWRIVRTIADRAGVRVLAIAR